MTNYWDIRFLQHIDKNNVFTIFEVGARYGEESIELSNIFDKSTLYSFECNPLTIEICRSNLLHMERVHFFPYGLGDSETIQPFYSYILNNDGASSLYKRIDFEQTQCKTGDILIRKITNIVKEYNIPSIDILCMDVQGYELNILRGCDEFLLNVKYIIMEEPKLIINTLYLPENVHSKYIGSPTSAEIAKFMVKHNFKELCRIDENAIEDNVLYVNTQL